MEGGLPSRYTARTQKMGGQTGSPPAPGGGVTDQRATGGGGRQRGARWRRLRRRSRWLVVRSGGVQPRHRARSEPPPSSDSSQRAPEQGITPTPPLLARLSKQPLAADASGGRERGSNTGRSRGADPERSSSASSASARRMKTEGCPPDRGHGRKASGVPFIASGNDRSPGVSESDPGSSRVRSRADAAWREAQVTTALARPGAVFVAWSTRRAGRWCRPQRRGR